MIEADKLIKEIDGALSDFEEYLLSRLHSKKNSDDIREGFEQREDIGRHSAIVTCRSIVRDIANKYNLLGDKK